MQFNIKCEEVCCTYHDRLFEELLHCRTVKSTQVNAVEIPLLPKESKMKVDTGVIKTSGSGATGFIYIHLLYLLYCDPSSSWIFFFFRGWESTSLNRGFSPHCEAVDSVH